MMRQRIQASVLLVWILFLTGGCAGITGQRRIPEDSLFNTRKHSDIVADEKIEAPIPPTVPTVKIIKGTEVSGMEEARRKLAQSTDAPLKGLQEELRSLVLRDVSIRVLAELLTEACGYNVVVTNTIADHSVNVYLKELTLRTALESICRLNDLWYREGHGIITLMTRDEYLQDIEIRQSDQTRAFFIRYTNAADMAKVIQAAMGEQVHLAVVEDEKIYGHIDPEEEAEVGSGAYEGPVLSPENPSDGGLGRVERARVPGSVAASDRKTPVLAILTVFKRNNCIVARSLDGSLLNEMAGIIEALDTPTNQVLLEIRILQLSLDDGFESFFDFIYTEEGRSGTGFTGAFDHTVNLLGGTVGATTLDYVFDGAKLDARIAFYERAGRAETIATPFLMAANNSKVEFFVGEETPLRDDVQTKTIPVGEQGDTITTFEVNIAREELGTDVEMTTFINEDGTITLDFEAEISSPLLNYSTIQIVNEKTGQVIDFPLDGTSKSELKSILSAKSGQSIAIGGIIKETIDFSETKVPIAGDIPLLGFFFKKIKDTKRKTETVIILTPHVVAHPALAGGVSDGFLGRKSSHEQITEGKENILEE
jgi:type II secretory pathway component GspD/PulD (secretin)